MLMADKFALCAAIFLIVIVVMAIIGPSWLGDLATKQNLRGRNAAPFDFEKAWVWWMGADALGRPLLARIIVATQNTVMVAAGAVLISAITGTVLGLIAGFSSPRVSQIIMRLAGRHHVLPVAVDRRDRALHPRLFDPEPHDGARDHAHPRLSAHHASGGAGDPRTHVRPGRPRHGSLEQTHSLPAYPAVVLPTLTTLATLDFAYVMLAESALSFLGIGIQPPEITWGLMIQPGSAVSHQCLVAFLLAGPRDHPDDDVAEPSLELDADCA